ncbi:RHS repeat-associated core domain-containing protein [Stenotrophomonas sp. PFBMAA-4]|uniref:RHS repeat domain-containing protein n=1 Tax=Stenotrophomonas sp. PFBMAA-4 TaxID=3043301 RepID=UPI0024B5A064|nr:RHS repeat-associated core domain-containing protein [Stenotrophomonas sp. PFBMAA-4]MDI9274313.1 RHS repeat-associated core domain-containing protein [Stenotrophomonas sp. PFBMAA-4]
MADVYQSMDHVTLRLRGHEKRIRKLGLLGQWLICVLLIGLGLSPSAVGQTTVTYIHTDALGSVVAESDANGNVIKRYDYEPYGSLVGGQIDDGPGYTGHVSDSATGLSYMQQRYMDPQLGVFLSVDPVTAYEHPLGQFNRYRYANGNPYRFTDPDGRDALDAARGFVDGMSSNFLATPSLAQQQQIDWAPQPFGGLGGNEGNADYALGRGAANALTTAMDVLSGGAAGAGASGRRAGAEGLAEARAARDALAGELAPLKGRAPATVTAGYNVKTGKVAARACGGGTCAEGHVAKALGGNKADIRFTEAVRPRTGAEVPVCASCEAEYGRGAFPKEAKFQRDELSK